MPWPCSGQTRAVLDSGIALAKRPDSKAASPRIGRGARKSCRLQSSDDRRGVYWHKRAPNVPDPVQPPIFNFKCEENTAWPKHPANLRKSTILQLLRTQMMKHQNRNCRRKRFVNKWQCNRVALNHAGICPTRAGTESGSKSMVVFETGHPGCPASQLVGRCARPRS